MAIKYIDGFAHYGSNGTVPSTAAPNLWSRGGNVAGDFEIANMPELGGKAILTDTALTGGIDTQGTLVSPVAFNSGSTIGIGAYCYWDNLGFERSVFGYGSSPTSTSACLTVSSGGILSFRRGSTNGSVLGSSTQNLTAGVLYHIEMKIYVHSSAGTVEVRVNGEPWLELSGVNTSGPGTYIKLEQANRANVGDAARYTANLFIWDGTGDVNNDFLGERIVYTLFPDADTAQADWSLSGGSDGYDLINDVPPNGSTNYIQSSNVGEESIFGLSDLDSTGVSVSAVQVVIQGQKDEAADGSIQFGPVTAIGTPDYNEGSEMTRLQFLYFYHVSEKNPDTDAPYVAAEVNSLQVGVKRTA